jgi:nitrate reductase gamma subunit
MELEITWKRAIRVYWAWLWRWVITFVIALAILITFGFVIGFIVGFIMSKFGFQAETIQSVSTTIGTIFGLVGALIAPIFPLKRILGRNFGEFRLVLLAKDTPRT